MSVVFNNAGFDSILRLILFIFACGWGLFSLWAAFISWREKETRASIIALLLGVAVVWVSFSIVRMAVLFPTVIIVVLLSAPAIIMAVPLKPVIKTSGEITSRFDERDTMFSRSELQPGTDRYMEYYQRKPDNLSVDNKFRAKPGLLSENAFFYRPFSAAAAQASFSTIALLDQHLSEPVNNITGLQPADHKTQTEKTKKITAFLKGWAGHLGACQTGVTQMHDYHYYSYGGRKERYGIPVVPEHTYGFVIAVEMKHDVIACAPKGPATLESAARYMDCAVIAMQAAEFIRSFGYSARAHVDGNYEVICPLVARDAGLGEIGRMGLLMTSQFGPRVRLAVVTTDLPLETDEYIQDNSILHFCTICKKCASCCPSRAISFGEREYIDGVWRWKLKDWACFAYWCSVGTDCGICMRVCPYAHPNTRFHNLIRKGIKNSSLFAKLALLGDHLFYRSCPRPAKPPAWLSD